MLSPGTNNGFQIYFADVSHCELSSGLTQTCPVNIKIVSQSANGTLANTNGIGNVCASIPTYIQFPGSCDPRISPDGRFVAFISKDASLGVTNGNLQLFVADSCQSSGTQVCGNPQAYGPFSVFDNKQANADVITPSIANLGRYLAFASTATNLTPSSTPTSGHSQVYFVDDCTPWALVPNCTPSAIIASTPDGTTAGNNDSTLPAINERGDSIFFESLATNLYPLASGIHRSPTCALTPSCCTCKAGAGILVNRSTPLNGTSSSWPIPSPDSSLLVFSSNSTNTALTSSNQQLVYTASFNWPPFYTVTLPFPFCIFQIWHLVLTLILVLIVIVFAYRWFRVNRGAARNAS